MPPTPFHPTTFGAALVQARAERKLSQQALAAALGVARSTVARWETLTSATGHKDGLTEANLAMLRQYFGRDLVAAQAPPTDVTLAYWAGRAEQVAAHLELVLAEQRRLVADMGGGEADALRAAAIATTRAAAAAAAAHPPASATPARRRRRG